MRIGTVKQIWRYPVKSMGGELLVECSVGMLGLSGDRGWALRDEKTREITNGKQIPLLMQCSARFREDPTEAIIPDVDITCPDGTIIPGDAPDVDERLSRAVGKAVTFWSRQPASNTGHYRRASMLSRLSRYKVVRDQLPRIMKLPQVDAMVREMFSREPGEPLPDLLQLPPEILEYTSPPGTHFDAFPIHLLTTASLNAMAKFNPDAAWDVRRFRPNFLIDTTEIEGLVEAEWAGRIIKVGAARFKCESPTVRCGMTTHAQQELPEDPSVLRSIVKNADQNLGIYASVEGIGHIKTGADVELL